MIGWDDIYKVLSAMTPLFVALFLGYGSVKWWHMFTPDQTNAINRLNCYFILPLFTFEFTIHVDPFRLNYPFIAADIISKSIILLILALWTNCGKKGSDYKFSWSITNFSLSSLSNTLVVGVPLMKAMYGDVGENLVLQSFVVQSVLWFMMLLSMLEFRRTKNELGGYSETLSGKDLEGDSAVLRTKPSLLLVMKIVAQKLCKNPNTYACVLGVVWACLSNRWSLQMPTIMEGSILIMSRAGAGISMFCMGVFNLGGLRYMHAGLFMAAQEKIIACGIGMAIYGMILRFIVGPATMAIGSVAVGLRGDILRVAIIQAALPQSLTSFIFAKEYGLHANVLSTAVIFGTIASLPLLLAYYAVIEFLR